MFVVVLAIQLIVNTRKCINANRNVAKTFHVVTSVKANAINVKMDVLRAQPMYLEY